MRGLIDPERQCGLEQGCLDELPLSRPMSLLQRGQNADRKVHAGGDIGDRDRHPVGRPLRRAACAHQSGHALRDEIEATPVAIGTGLPETRNRRIDQAGVARRQGSPREPQPFERAWTKVLDEDIGCVDEAEERCLPVLTLQVERDRSLVPIPDQERCAFVADKRGIERASSPPSGRSTLMTSAPWSPSSIAQYGPDKWLERSMTRIRSNAPTMGNRHLDKNFVYCTRSIAHVGSVFWGARGGGSAGNKDRRRWRRRGRVTLNGRKSAIRSTWKCGRLGRLFGRVERARRCSRDHPRRRRRGFLRRHRYLDSSKVRFDTESGRIY